MRTGLACLVALLLWLQVFPAPAFAHGFQTAYLELREQPSGLVDVTWKAPTQLSLGDEWASRPMAIRPVFPQTCKATTLPAAMRTPTANVIRWTLDCGDRGLAEQTVTFPGLVKSFVEVLLRVEWANGRSQTTLLPTGQETFEIPEKVTVFALGQTYLQLGVEHIFSGPDHLLFVLGLVLIVGPSWQLVKTITAFTLAHSMTLGAATLGFVNVPQAPVEAVIALSILFLASELAHSRRGQPGITEQYPWVVALTFGLLHGFGFAGALAEVGLPTQDIAPALLFFNGGVEMGQLAFILMVVALITGTKHIISDTSSRWVGWVSTYSIGTLASFWFLQRVSAFG